MLCWLDTKHLGDECARNCVHNCLCSLVSPSSAAYVPSLLLQAVYKTEIVACHLSHLCGGAQRDILLSFGMPDFL